MKFVELKKLKEFRKNSSYTYQKMADMLFLSKTFYWQIENGLRNLSYENAVKIADIFNTTPDNLFIEDFKKII